MKYFSTYNRGDQNSLNLEEKLKNILADNGFIYDTEKAELIFIVGGDGTVLRCIHEYLNKLDKVKFISIHTGTLGFYTDFTENEIPTLIEELKQYNKGINKYVHNYNLVEAKITLNNNSSIIVNALNEFRIENILKTQTIDVEISNIYFETFRGNGFCVCTPSGSTAYNKSLGGSVIHPNIKCLQLTEISGISHNKYRSLESSLILDEEKIIKFTTNEYKGVVIGYDNFVVDEINYNDIKSIECYLAKNTASFLALRHLHFVERLKRTFVFDDIN